MIPSRQNRFLLIFDDCMALGVKKSQTKMEDNDLFGRYILEIYYIRPHRDNTFFYYYGNLNIPLSYKGLTFGYIT